MTDELIYKLELNKKKDKIYYLDQDGDICEGPMCGITEHNPIKFQSGKTIHNISIVREIGFLYFIGKTGNIYKKPLKE